MVTKANKIDVIKALSAVREKTLLAIESLHQNTWAEVFLGTWSLADLVAHFIGWDIEGKKATKEILQRKLPSYYLQYDKNWATINNDFVKKYKKGDKHTLLAAVRKSHAQLVAELEKVSENLFNKDFGIRWKGKIITVASDTMSQAIDEEKHFQKIKYWLKQMPLEKLF